MASSSHTNGIGKLLLVEMNELKLMIQGQYLSNIRQLQLFLSSSRHPFGCQSRYVPIRTCSILSILED
jgi:hypothetical protein